MRRHSLSLGVTLLALAVTIAGVASGGNGNTGQSDFLVDGETRAEQNEAYKVGGLLAAASLTGTYVLDAHVPAAGGPASLDEVTRLSDVVVVATVLSNRMRLTDDGRDVRTLYTVMPDLLLKGSLQATGLDVLIPGGRVTFGNGATAWVRARGFAPPENDRRYLFFLRHTDTQVAYLPQDSPAPAIAFEPVDVHGGIFDVTEPSLPIRPNGNRRSPVPRFVSLRGLTGHQLVELVASGLRGRP